MSCPPGAEEHIHQYSFNDCRDVFRHPRPDEGAERDGSVERRQQVWSELTYSRPRNRQWKTVDMCVVNSDSLSLNNVEVKL